VSKQQLVTVNAIMSQQQPAGQAFFDLAPSVGQGSLNGLRHERMHITQEDVMQGGARPYGRSEFTSGQAKAIARDLHVCLVRNAIAVAHYDRHGRHTLATDNAHLDGVFSVRDYRGDAALDEVHLLDAAVARCKYFAKGEINGLEVAL
jgi:hypothetical protein